MQDEPTPEELKNMSHEELLQFKPVFRSVLTDEQQQTLENHNLAYIIQACQTTKENPEPREITFDILNSGFSITHYTLSLDGSLTEEVINDEEE